MPSRSPETVDPFGLGERGNASSTGVRMARYVVIVLLLLCAGCGVPTAEKSPSASPPATTATASPTAAPSASASGSPSISPWIARTFQVAAVGLRGVGPTLGRKVG